MRLTLALGQCRASREPLSIVALGVQPTEPLPADQARTIERILEAACRSADTTDVVAKPVEGRRVIVLPGRDRQDAIDAARALVERLLKLVGPLHRAGQLVPCVGAAGVATVAEPSKNFRVERLLETADRCLMAALGSGGVKSLEVI